MIWAHRSPHHNRPPLSAPRKHDRVGSIIANYRWTVGSKGCAQWSQLELGFAPPDRTFALVQRSGCIAKAQKSQHLVAKDLARWAFDCRVRREYTYRISYYPRHRRSHERSQVIRTARRTYTLPISYLHHLTRRWKEFAVASCTLDVRARYRSAGSLISYLQLHPIDSPLR